MTPMSWRAESRANFEKIMFLLAKRVHGATGWSVRQFEGRGGDTGLDILAEGPNGDYVVYQLKFFPDGLTGSNRRRQVERSLESAIKHHPQMTRWALVTPCLLTVGQTAWFKELSSRCPQASVELWDESHIDDLLTRFPDVYTYARRDDILLESARVLGQERAILANPAEDIPARVTALLDIANTVDPDFAVDIQTDGTDVRLTARPKHASARQHLDTKFTFPEGYEHYLDDLRELADYGITEEVVLPPEVIVSVNRRGPAFMAVEPPDQSRQTLTFKSEAEPEPITLRVLNEDEEIVGTHPGTVRITGGLKGVKLTAILHDALHVIWRVPLDDSDEQPATVFTLAPHGHPCSNVIASCRLLAQLLTIPRLEIEVRGAPFGLTTREPRQDTPLRSQIVLATAEDLETVQRATATYFLYPKGLTDLDRTHLRVCRMLCQGKTAIAPTPFLVEFELDDPPPAAMTPGPIWLDGQQIAFQVAEHELVLRNITIWHPKGWLTPTPGADSDEALTYALEPRREPFILSPDGAASIPEPWGLIGVLEPETPNIPDGLFPNP